MASGGGDNRLRGNTESWKLIIAHIHDNQPTMMIMTMAMRTMAKMMMMIDDGDEDDGDEDDATTTAGGCIMVGGGEMAEC